MNSTNPTPRPWLRHLIRLKANRNVIYAFTAAITAGLFVATLQLRQNQNAAALIFSQPDLGALPVIPENMRWGFAMDEFALTTTELHNGDVLGEILLKQGMAYPQVAQLVNNSKDKFSITSMRVGRQLFFMSKKGAATPRYMVYEPSPYEYVTFQLTEPFEVKVVKRDFEVKTVAASGVLETSFWEALTDNGLNDALADGMIDILASSVDFYHQRQGDRFKMVYEQHIVEGKPVGTGKILAALYEREGKEYYAFNYEDSPEGCKYFDFEGRPARKAFLKAPVKFSRISSRYNLKRLHPILGYHKAHFGTDYAAPHGTPIMAVAEGVVLEATRRGGNGNFVKIRHDKTYETQYLHMSGFARGIRPGTRVAQGQTIGYVGSTGLATGPHCCFRFWKNGQQVDHLRLNLPQPNPITGEAFAKYVPVRDALKKMLDGVPYRTKEELEQLPTAP